MVADHKDGSKTLGIVHASRHSNERLWIVLQDAICEVVVNLRLAMGQCSGPNPETKGVSARLTII